ncbi:MAG: hemolysin family protein [Alistipes sp.]|nr:hemolysin family protein [Alistipes sp.]
MISVLVTVFFALLFSAFFSGMEIAFLSSNKLKLEIEKKQHRIFGYIVDLFARHPGQYITTILVGNNLALVLYSLQMSLLIQGVMRAAGVGVSSGTSYLIETLISTIIIIFSAEFIPKTVVKLNPNLYYRVFALPLYLFYLLFYPVAKLTTWVALGVFRLFGMSIHRKESLHTFSRVDLAHLLDEASESPQQQQVEKDIRLFQNALDFSDRQVRDCMIPRVDIEAIELHEPVEEVVRRLVETHYSRLLVYDGNIDNIVGFIHTKSLFLHPRSISERINGVEYVPESMPTRKLLAMFIKRHHSVAVVIDEFGGTSGMVTLEDVLEEIFGDIEDEHDLQDLVEKQISDREYLFSGRVEIETINEKYHLGIPESEAYDTLAGYVIDKFQGIPAVGETVVADRMRMKILRVDASKVELVRISLL